MTQIFGNFVEPTEGVGEYLKIGFSPSSVSLQQRWRNNGLSADFLADYLSTFFPGEDTTSSERQAEIKDAVSYIANEVLENAMKYSYAPSHHTVSIEMILKSDVISLYTINSIDPSKIGPFQAFIQRLLIEDPDDFLVEQMERNAEADEKADNDGVSGLGFLTMLNDYGTTLAWKFATHSTENENDVAVTTMVRLSV